MAAKNKPYEQFGTYILFKKLESDALSELWRAARVEGAQLGSLVALRRLTGGDRAALVAAAETAREVVPQLTGSSFARQQVIGVVNGVPFVAHDYSGGRSLRHIVDRARGGAGVTPNAIPIDQAIVIVEKVALSLETLSNLKQGNTRLVHGALIPQFIWVSDDGEIRVAGQMLGKGVIASLKDPKVAQEIGRYFPLEYQATGEPQKTSSVYGVGAILYLILTGSEPPDPMTSSAWTQSVRAAKTMAGAPIPDDIRVILDKSFVLDPNARYASISDMKQALSALAHGGKYSASTFNLAFYLSNLLKKEMEGEVVEREKESKVNVAAYVDVPPAMLPTAVMATPLFEAYLQRPRSKAPLAIAAVLIVAAIGAGAWFLTTGSKPKSAPAPKLAGAGAPVVPQKPKIVSEPIVASPPTTTAVATASVDPAAQKKAFEEAVNQKLQQEMMKLQEDYTKQLQKQQSKNAPVATAAPPPVTSPPPRTATAAADERAPSAAQLDASRRETAARVESAAPATATATIVQTQPPPAAVPVSAPPTVHEGDVIAVGDLDTPPHIAHAVRPQYPPMAVRQRIEGTVLLTVLVTENGDVADVRLLRGDNRFGLDDAAIRAARATKFSPPIKDGKHVKTWFPLPFVFKM